MLNYVKLSLNFIPCFFLLGFMRSMDSLCFRNVSYQAPTLVGSLLLLSLFFFPIIRLSRPRLERLQYSYFFFYYYSFYFFLPAATSPTALTQRQYNLAHKSTTLVSTFLEKHQVAPLMSRDLCSKLYFSLIIGSKAI